VLIGGINWILSRSKRGVGPSQSRWPITRIVSDRLRVPSHVADMASGTDEVCLLGIFQSANQDVGFRKEAIF
jgi:hypothetical protein